MKIYAVRDRLIDYYMQPFVGPNEKEVMHALSRTINNSEDTNGIAQAPHHFELWELGIIDDEEGQITPTRRLVCDCASLIRGNIRKGGPQPGGEETATSEISRSRTPDGYTDGNGHPPGTPLPRREKGSRESFNETHPAA